ncbi:putative NAD dependent epimerase/dehydratase [Aspergillus flavus AF70]|nr:putative NAD dependent epimerase/dehydratase [Aspergillus flavus AF70]
MSHLGSGQHVLLTGANGSVASHILAILLEVYLLPRESWIRRDCHRALAAKGGRYHQSPPLVEGQDQLRDCVGSFNALFEEVTVPFIYIIHTAPPLNINVKDIQKEMIEPAVIWTTQILESAHRQGGTSLKRFVLLAEDAAWKFMKTNNPVFDLVVINPDIITGPMIHPISGPRSINETNHFTIANFYRWDELESRGCAVDVRHVVRSHVDALTNPAARGKRILLISGLITPQLVVNLIRKHFPALREQVPEGKPDQVLPHGVHPTGWDMRVSLDVLSKGTNEGQWKFIDLGKSVMDAMQSMINHNVV